MKNTLTLLTGVLCALCSFAQITSFDVQTVAVHTGIVGTTDLSGFTTYRLYANMTHPDDELVGMAGVIEFTDTVPFVFETTGPLYQHPDGADLGNQIQCALFDFIPEIEYDSWFTIGLSCSNQDGNVQVVSGSSVDAQLASFYDATIDGDPVGVNSPDIAFFTSVLDVAGEQDENGQVLLGQFTIASDAIFSGSARFLSILEGVPGASEFQDLAFVSEGIAGCNDPDALNYNPDATFDDGSCEYTCLTFTIESEEINCFGESAAIVLVPDDNTIGTVFAGEGEGLLFPDSLNYSLDAGTYTFTVEDSNCSVSQDFTLESPPELVVAESSLEYAEDGTFSAGIEVAGGVAPYTYEWFHADGPTPAQVFSTEASFSGAVQGYYDVEITDANGCTLVEFFIFVGVENITVGIPEVKLFPNPAHNQLQVEASQPIMDIVWIDGLGKTVDVPSRRVGANTYQFETAQLAAGWYFVKVRTELGQTTQKLSIVH